MSRATELAKELEGTCMNYPETDDWTTQELEELDSLVFECMICGWWFDTMDEVEEQTCSDCYEEYEAEE